MKRIVICQICKKPVGLYRSYQVRIEQTLEPYPGQFVDVKRKSRICSECCRLAGYKIRGKEKEMQNKEI